MSSRFCILLVSSDADVLNARTAMLQQAGYVVLTAMDLREVLAACERKVDAVILASNLPVKEKSRIVTTVRSQCRAGTPIVALYDGDPSETDDADRAVSDDDTSALLAELASVRRSARQKSH